MDLASKHVYEVLVNQGVTSLYHANSVWTACHFLRTKSLLSRGIVERLGLTQTPQDSDEVDKRHSVWFDVFVDSVDIHHRARRRNVYGPVLLVLDVSVIERAYTGRVWVTKLNPTNWQGHSRDERWFQSKDDLEANFTYGTFDHMVVFRHCGGALPFGRFLDEIILDDPQLETDSGVDFFSAAYGALQLAMSDAGLGVPITKRQCRAGCQCTTSYANAQDANAQMFIALP